MAGKELNINSFITGNICHVKFLYLLKSNMETSVKITMLILLISNETHKCHKNIKQIECLVKQYRCEPAEYIKHLKH